MNVTYLTGNGAVRQGHPKGRTCARDAAILEYLRTYIAARGYGPTLREIGAAVGIPTISSVDYRLRGLESAGLITRQREISRSIRPVEPAGCVCHCGHRHKAAEAAPAEKVG